MASCRRHVPPERSSGLVDPHPSLARTFHQEARLMAPKVPSRDGRGRAGVNGRRPGRLATDQGGPLIFGAAVR